VRNKFGTRGYEFAHPAQKTGRKTGIPKVDFRAIFYDDIATWARTLFFSERNLLQTIGKRYFK